MNKVLDVLRSAEAKLDEWGRPGWIAAIVLGFIVAWPIGLALIIYTLWSGRMKNFGKRWGCRHGAGRAHKSTGNVAFDEYRQETLKRLEEEREDFVSFLDKLRQAKDRAEFEQFMDQRRNGGASAQPAT